MHFFLEKLKVLSSSTYSLGIAMKKVESSVDDIRDLLGWCKNNCGFALLDFAV